MHRRTKATAVKLLVIIIPLLAVPSIFLARPLFVPRPQAKPPADLAAKLAQKATFTPPRDEPALAQLIEVAKHYRLPMGIEWDESAARADAPLPRLPASDEVTVLELINVILRQAPTHLVRVDKAMLHVAPPALAALPNNPLNLRVKEFQVTRANLYQAAEELRLMIDGQLHPEEYTGGYMGGLGYPPDEDFAMRPLTFTGTQLSVREILDGLTEANGQVLWLVRLNEAMQSATQTGSAPEREQATKRSEFWQFIPLQAERKAPEIVVLELQVAGFEDVQKIDVPVQPGAGGIGGGFAEQANNCAYQITVLKQQRDSVTLQLKVTLKNADAVENSINEKIEVVRAGAREYQLRYGVTVKAYFK